MLKLNLTDDQLNSTAPNFEVLPTGDYICYIANAETVPISPTSKNNAGKPMLKLRLMVSEGPYKDRNIFANLMLFEGEFTLNLITQLVKVLFPHFIDNETKTLTIPEDEAFQGKTVVVTGKKFIEGSAIGKTGRKRTQAEFSVRGFKPTDAVTSKVASDNSLLP